MTTYPYRINLRGPWQYEPLARTVLLSDGRIESCTVSAPLPPPGRMNLPCAWTSAGLENFRGRVRFLRRFHKPRQIDANERVWLAFSGADYFTTAWLNGALLGRHEGMFDPFAFDITRHLAVRNELIVETDSPAITCGTAFGGNQRMVRGTDSPGGLWGEVGLEMRREAYVAKVRLWATFTGGAPTLHVAGELVDELSRSLEFYVLLDNRTVLYETIAGAPEGRAFHVTAVLGDVERWQPAAGGTPRLYEVRTELIDGASKLDVRVWQFGFRELAAGGEDNKLLLNGRELRVEDATVLSEPVLDCGTFDAADRDGSAQWCLLPHLGWWFAEDESVRAEVLRQVRAMITHLQRHPAIIGWKWLSKPHPKTDELNQRLRALVSGMDETRPCVIVRAG